MHFHRWEWQSLFSDIISHLNKHTVQPSSLRPSSPLSPLYFHIHHPAALYMVLLSVCCRKFAPRCCVCGHAIMPQPGNEETVRIVAMDKSFHVECYKCEVHTILIVACQLLLYVICSLIIVVFLYSEQFDILVPSYVRQICCVCSRLMCGYDLKGNTPLHSSTAILNILIR